MLFSRPEINRTSTSIAATMKVERLILFSKASLTLNLAEPILRCVTANKQPQTPLHQSYKFKFACIFG